MSSDESGPAPAASAESHSVRIRGIYTTALTKRFLDAGWSVVDASSPIERRFAADFDTAAEELTISTTADRQGIGVHGTAAALEAATALLDSTGLDTFSWRDPAPVGSLFSGTVTSTRRGGAVVDLGDTEGYLPFRNTEDRVETGDTIRVQVREPAAPWSDDRPLLDTDMQVSVDLVSLLPESGAPTVDTRDETAACELVGMTDLLGVAAPEGWRIRWDHAATEASMDKLKSAVERAATRAETVADVLEGDETLPVDDEPAELLVETAGRWYWFGRESRFALDALRREVTPTLSGHHRIKAGAEAASAGVDFAEAFCGSDQLGATVNESTDETTDAEDFPFAVVADCFGPAVGDTIEIGHGKPSGRLISLGSGTVVNREDDSVTVRREMSPGGRYDALDVPRSAGDTATTTFREGRWWYPTVYRDREESVIGTYVNICTPVECFPNVIRYIDLHVDVIKHADGTVERVDDEELERAVTAGFITQPLAEKTDRVATALENAL